MIVVLMKSPFDPAELRGVKQFHAEAQASNDIETRPKPMQSGEIARQ